MPMLPRSVRWTLRRLYFLPFDVVDQRVGQHADLVPPMSEIYDGGGHAYLETGARFVQLLVGANCLRPDFRVLDIGCGMGRLAVALSKYLSDDGLYEGVDIVPSAIQWGRRTISSRFPRFHFTHADVFNAEYNPRGHGRAAEYTFPFADNSFDLTVLCSVFTHLVPEDVEHYLFEIARMLAPGGRCFATWFLLNDDSRGRLASGESAIDFKHNFGNYATVSTRVPELSIAYDEEYLKRMLDAAGLEVVRTYYGGWCGREPLWSPDASSGDQDVVVVSRRDAAAM